MLAAATVAFFVFFGIWGGLERQSYLLGYSLHEQRELLSLRAGPFPIAGHGPFAGDSTADGAFLDRLQQPGTLPAALYDRPGPRDFVTVAGDSPEQYSTVEGGPTGQFAS